jgi:hypothetical protein
VEVSLAAAAAVAVWGVDCHCYTEWELYGIQIDCNRIQTLHHALFAA